ncbi:MAG: hypothetical protein JJD92_08675 [Frankiaceae bacterium]|nr:hypothetical protein [Frankiaceae bacterium]
MESYLMTVVCSPGPSTLARIVAVLHARKAAIDTLHYDSGTAHAELAVRVASADVMRLAAQIGRIVDVTDVHVAIPARVAVAS